MSQKFVEKKYNTIWGKKISIELYLIFIYIYIYYLIQNINRRKNNDKVINRYSKIRIRIA